MYALIKVVTEIGGSTNQQVEILEKMHNQSALNGIMQGMYDDALAEAGDMALEYDDSDGGHFYIIGEEHQFDWHIVETK